MADILKMPNPLAGSGIKGDQAVGKEVVSNAIRAVKIHRRGSRGGIDNSTLCVQRHSCPIVGSSGVTPSIFGPSFVSEFSGMRNGVECPSHLAGMNVVGANIARRSRQGFWLTASYNNKVVINYARTGQINRLSLGRESAKAFAKINPPVVAKSSYWFSGNRVERIEKVHHAN